jgi:hypothetical protein
VSHLDSGEVFRETAPTLGPLRHLASYNIDWQQRSVSARIVGMAYSRAIYRQAEGCIVLVGLAPKPPAILDAPDAGPAIITNALPGAGVVKPINSALGLAIDEQFEEPQNTASLDEGGRCRQGRADSRGALCKWDRTADPASRVVYVEVAHQRAPWYPRPAGAVVARSPGECSGVVRPKRPMARGSYGQYVLISPSQRLTIVRLGTAYTRAGDLGAMERLTANVVRALSPTTHN